MGTEEIRIMETLIFDRNESCEQGLRHPLYQIIDDARELRPGEGIRVLINDYDWIMVIKNSLKLIGEGIDIKDNGKAMGDFTELIIYRKQ
ncbi:hypothetical protein [Vulcanisaeta thermophila]|uniref:hypothetical protein n=1 Tax=Vulcanisaeta thermophila TaxID=867917 RepID=UPI000852DB59|nr:hypothetical protein [Vulcanisaeta thermophila]